MEKYRAYEGISFYFSQGYYINGKHGLMHRHIWKREVGEIPKGSVIHHIDESKTNNDLENLVCIPKRIHDIYHWRTMSQEKRMKLKNNRKGKDHPMFGKTHTKEARDKISDAHKGKPLSEEHKKMLSIVKGTKIYCVNNGKEYHSIAEAERRMGIRHIARAVKAGKPVKGFMFKYV